VAYLLASRWDDLHELEHFAEANKAFRVFVLKHIDATASEKDLRRILEHTKDVRAMPGRSAARLKIELALR